MAAFCGYHNHCHVSQTNPHRREYPIGHLKMYVIECEFESYFLDPKLMLAKKHRMFNLSLSDNT